MAVNAWLANIDLFYHWSNFLIEKLNFKSRGSNTHNWIVPFQQAYCLEKIVSHFHENLTGFLICDLLKIIFF